MKYMIFILLVNVIIVLYFQYMKTNDFKVRFADIILEEELNIIKKMNKGINKQNRLKTLEEEVTNTITIPIDIKAGLLNDIKEEYNK